MDHGARTHLRRACSRRAALLAALGAAVLVLAGIATSSASAETVWLCKPGLSANPCLSSEETTVELGNGKSFVEDPHPASRAPIDCFYVYPTVSGQTTFNANLSIEPEETQVAIDQASRFSQVCNVYAPMYPQLTIDAELAEVGSGAFNHEQVETAYAGVLSAWREYLAKYNHGRGVVLIGHSQGAGMLRKLIKQEIDTNPAQRKLLVSALLMGGNVSVPEGKIVGGDFQHIPACQAVWETHCVVAYSSFLVQPPADTLFGVVDGPVSTLGERPRSGSDLQVLCVNPTLLVQDGGSGPLLQYAVDLDVPRLPGLRSRRLRTRRRRGCATPGQYAAQCKHEGDATWLQVTDVRSRGRSAGTARGNPRTDVRPAPV